MQAGNSLLKEDLMKMSKRKFFSSNPQLELFRYNGCSVRFSSNKAVTTDQNNANERENYSYQIHNSETANITLVRLLEVEENYIHKIGKLGKKVKTSGTWLCLLDDDSGKWLSYPDTNENVSSKAQSDSNQWLQFSTG